MDGKQPTYGAVLGDQQILGFSYFVAHVVSLEELRTLASREFPPDAKRIDSYSDGRCRIESYKSGLLEQAIGRYTMVVAYPDPEPGNKYRDAIFTIGTEGERDRC